MTGGGLATTGAELALAGPVLAPFMLGTVAQVILLCWRVWSVQDAVAIIVAPVLVYPFMILLAEDLWLGTLLGSVLLAGATAIKYRKHIMPRIDERTLVAYTTAFWFVFATEWYVATPGWQMLTVLAAVPTLGVAGLVLSRTRLAFPFRVLAYTWFIVLLITLLAAQFSCGHMAVFWDSARRPAVSGLDMLATGMAFTFLAANGTHLYRFVRLPDEGEDRATWMSRWRAHVQFLAGRWKDEQVSLLGVVAIVGVFAALYLGNAALGLVSSALVINVWIIGVPQVLGAPGPLAGRADQEDAAQTSVSSRA